jgi:archaemetzincin
MIGHLAWWISRRSLPPGVRPADDRRRMILLRSMKVMSHETGHMFGITHCLHYECNMNGSNSLYETDSQPIHLCPVDLRKLHHAVGFDIDRRYLALAEFYAAQGLVEQAEFVRLRASTNQPKTD